MLVLLMLYMYCVSDVHKPLDHKLYSKANCLVLNLDAEHWLNECTSSHEVFGIGNSKCDRCLVAEISAVYTNLFPLMFAQYSCSLCQGNEYRASYF